jgi:hypothetical protein
MIGRIAIGAVLALFAVAYGVALQNLHAAGWTNPAAAIGTLRRSEHLSPTIEAKGSCTQVVVCRGSAEHRIERDTP